MLEIDPGCTCDECPWCGSHECYIASSADGWTLRCGNTDQAIPDCPIHPDEVPDA